MPEERRHGPFIAGVGVTPLPIGAAGPSDSRSWSPVVAELLLGTFWRETDLSLLRTKNDLNMNDPNTSTSA